MNNSNSSNGGYVCSNCGQWVWYSAVHVCTSTRPSFAPPQHLPWPPLTYGGKSARDIQLDDAYLKALIAYHETLLRELRRIDGTLEE